MYSRERSKKILNTLYPKMGAVKNNPLHLKYLKHYGANEKKKRTKKSPPSLKMEYSRKKPDYAHTAYREAVGRLRILLAESYSPRKRTTHRDFLNSEDDDEESETQSIISIISRTSKLPVTSLTTDKYKTQLPSHSAVKERSTDPTDLSSFLERQEDYIHQLERESKFCRKELPMLIGKVREMLQENNDLHEKQKNKLIKSVFDQFDTETDTADEALQASKSDHQLRPIKFEGPSIVYESRISELEAQLTQAKIDLKKALEATKPISLSDSDSTLFSELKQQVETLKREKATLEETVLNLQAAINKLRDKEHSSADHMKRSLDIAEQAQYEKSAADHEIRRLKDELERQHGKLRDAINEQARRIADERASVERRYSQQIEQLNSEMGVNWEQNNKLQLELSKAQRETADLRRELTQKQAQIDDLKKEMQNKIITLQSDIGVSGAEKSALEQQIATLQLGNERHERQSKQDAARVQVEMQSMRQRLDRADADLIHSRRENLRLTEQIAALEKEVNLANALTDERNKIIALPAPPPVAIVDETTNKIQQLETKHAATVAGLEGMIQSQNQLMDKLSAECHALTQKLDESSTRHKEEIRQLQSNLNYLSDRLTNSENIQQTVHAVENQENVELGLPINADNPTNAELHEQNQFAANEYDDQQSKDATDYQYAEGEYDNNSQYMLQNQFEQQQYGDYDPTQEEQQQNEYSSSNNPDMQNVQYSENEQQQQQNEYSSNNNPNLQNAQYLDSEQQQQQYSENEYSQNKN